MKRLMAGVWPSRQDDKDPVSRLQPRPRAWSRSSQAADARLCGAGCQKGRRRGARGRAQHRARDPARLHRAGPRPARLRARPLRGRGLAAAEEASRSAPVTIFDAGERRAARRVNRRALLEAGEREGPLLSATTPPPHTFHRDDAHGSMRTTTGPDNVVLMRGGTMKGAFRTPLALASRAPSTGAEAFDSDQSATGAMAEAGNQSPAQRSLIPPSTGRVTSLAEIRTRRK